MAKLTNVHEEQLLYHPDIQRIREEINSPGYMVAPKESKVIAAIDNRASSVWIDMYDILAEIKALIATIDARYTGSARGDVGQVSFKNYCTALQAQDYQTIKSYQSYQVDYMGKIDLEVYPILIELRSEWEGNIAFFKSSCLQQVQKDIPDNLEVDSVGFQEYQNRETAFINNMYLRYKDQEGFETKLRNRIAIDQDQYRVAVQSAAELQDRMDCQTESVENMKAKLAMARGLVDQIKHIVNVIAVDSSRAKDAQETFIKIPFEASDYNLIALSCKLSIDGMIKDLSKMEEERQSTASSEVRDKIHSDLAYATHIYNEASKPLARKVLSLDDMPLAAATFMTILNDGVQRSSSAYRLVLNSSYVMDENDKKLLGDKLEIIMRKNEARYYYRAVTGIIEYLEDKGKSPDGNELASILNNAL